jgi:hypothetical protein
MIMGTPATTMSIRGTNAVTTTTIADKSDRWLIELSAPIGADNQSAQGAR